MNSNLSKITRSTNGCHTCKRRRKKCDETRPKCHACLKLGIECEGYAKNLVWGNGVASRGKLRGAALPTTDYVPPNPSKNKEQRQYRSPRRRTNVQIATESVTSGQSPINDWTSGVASDDQHRQSSPAETSMELATTENDTLPWEHSSPEEAVGLELSGKLISDFFSHGHHTLYSTNTDDSPVIKSVLPLCRKSSTLRAVCVVYQALISFLPTEQFQSLYGIALQKFQADLKDNQARNEDSTIAAGLLFCSIGASQGIPWTFHIDPILQILTTRPDFATSPFHSHALDILGYYDLPSFVLNRKHARFNIWHRYCTAELQKVDSIEPVSGLPRSLLDIFSCLEDPDCEERLWLWHGHEGEVLQIFLWDAFRFSGMLKHRELCSDYAGRLREYDLSGLESSSSIRKSAVQLPTDGVLLNRLMACLHVIQDLGTRDGSNSLVMNAAIYPIFTAGCQVKLLRQHPEWDSLLFGILDKMIESGRRQVEPLRDILRSLKEGSSFTPDELAAQMGLEIALL